MSRSRNIKPGFFKNEALADLPFEYRILFQGLWCEADREGRLEDRVKRLKAELFPYDSVDVDAGLNALARAGFIARYEVAGQRYIEVLNFAKHQNPHKKEAASTIPAWDRSAPAREIPVQAPEIPERARLIPDSGFRIPDSGLPEPGASAPTPPKSRKRKELTFTQWVESLDGADAIPADDPVFAYAAKVGLPAEFVPLEWAWFEAKYADGAGKTKRYADWRQTFRNAVEGGWGNLWRVSSTGEYYLTTQGVQAQRGLA